MILITAFEPFGGKTWNASELILKQLNHRHDKCVLPVALELCKQVIDGLILDQYDTIVMLGEADRTLISLEAFAYNEINMRIPDNQGILLKDATIGIEPYYQTPFDLSKLCRPGIQVSHDPGRYLCNYAYYSMGMKHPNVLFIHVSASLDTIAQQTQLLEEVIYEIETISISR